MNTPVVIGIIDDGIAFAHQRFRTIVAGNPASRVEYWWLQDGVYQGGPLPFGCELTKAQINALLATCTNAAGTNAAAVDEEQLYRIAGLTDFRRPGHKSAAWRGAHGTHVMDLAGGYEQNDGGAEPLERPIVCVQLPIAVTADTSGGTLFPYAFLGMLYIVAQANNIAVARGLKNLPVVINLSYGYFAGPHDGTSAFEEAIESLIAQCAALGVTLRVVLPAGNSYLLRTHAQVSFQNIGQVVSLNWRVLPDCRTPSYLEIWLPYRAGGAGAAPGLKVTVTSPTGQGQTIQTGGAPQFWVSGLGFYGLMTYSYFPPQTDRGMMCVFLAPTANLHPNAALAPAGLWTVQLENLGLAHTDVVELWIQRDDSLYGFPIRGRQSYFDIRSYRRFDHEGRDNETDDPNCPVMRASTINAIATGASPIVMGGFERKELKAAEYSSAGPVSPTQGVLPPNSDGVTAMTVSEDSLVHAGVLGAGSRSGSVLAMDGTSVAAPQIARWVAGQLAIGNPGNRAAVQALAAAAPAPLAAAAATILAGRRGAGLIDLPPVVAVRRFDF